MINVVAAILLVAGSSYLLGSISSAVIVSRVFAGEDVRKKGSGNAGMTNILRNYGKFPAALTVIGDLGKAVIAIVLARHIFSFLGVLGFDAGYLAGVFVVLGHLFPLYFGFKGGKGVLTSVGTLLVVNPVPVLIVLIYALAIIFLSRRVSLGSVIGGATIPIVTGIVLYLRGGPWMLETVFAAVFGMAVLVMHRQNIRRLLNGTEPRLGEKKQAEQPEETAEKKTQDQALSHGTEEK